MPRKYPDNTPKMGGSGVYWVDEAPPGGPVHRARKPQRAVHTQVRGEVYVPEHTSEAPFYRFLREMERGERTGTTFGRRTLRPRD